MKAAVPIILALAFLVGCEPPRRMVAVQDDVTGNVKYVPADEQGKPIKEPEPKVRVLWSDGKAGKTCYEIDGHLYIESWGIHCTAFIHSESCSCKKGGAK